MQDKTVLPLTHFRIAARVIAPVGCPGMTLVYVAQEAARAWSGEPGHRPGLSTGATAAPPRDSRCMALTTSDETPGEKPSLFQRIADRSAGT